MERARILIVEDETLVAHDIENMVRNHGYELCGIATSGKEAVEIARATEPDLILMDIVLKGEIDGVEAAEKIREFFNVPVIYITAHPDASTLQRAKRTEPHGYSLKPLDQKELLTVIEMALYKHQMELKLKEREAWLSTILKSIGDGVIATDRQGNVTFMNPVAEKLTGWRESESIKKPLANILHLIDEETGKLYRLSAPRLINENVRMPLNGNILIVNYEEKIPVELTTTPITDEKGYVNGLVIVLHDLTESKRYEEKLRFNAVHDHLTELPNRLLFFDRLNLALAQAQRDGHRIAVLLLDLDEFKKVNDTWGHSAGDKLLQAVAFRLTSMFRKSDTIARLGGDEFVLILPEIPSFEVAKNVAERIVFSFQKPFHLDGLTVSITASIGLSCYPEDGNLADLLVTNADLAMYRAKLDGKNRYCAFSPELRESPHP